MMPNGKIVDMKRTTNNIASSPRFDYSHPFVIFALLTVLPLAVIVVLSGQFELVSYIVVLMLSAVLLTAADQWIKTVRRRRNPAGAHARPNPLPFVFLIICLYCVFGVVN
jgi:hypothetical protein